METRKLSCYEFGAELVQTRDLDPVYVLLHEAKLESVILQRWLLAYWCFYHVGTASWLADRGERYWEWMMKAAKSKDFPRCHERRHFRGKNAEKSVAYLSSIGTAGLFDRVIEDGSPTSLERVMDTVQEWVGFGPWIAFKVADMVERLGLRPVRFDAGAMFLFDSPREGAKLLWEAEGAALPPANASGSRTTEEYVQTWAVKAVLTGLARSLTAPEPIRCPMSPEQPSAIPNGVSAIPNGFPTLAPPRYERNLNCQEAETVLCKWKSYMGGHYRLGEDIEGCRKALMWRASPTNDRLQDAWESCYASHTK